MSVFAAATPLRVLLGATRNTAKREHISGRALRGLFAGRDKDFGNNVSFSKRKYVFGSCPIAPSTPLVLMYAPLLLLCRTRRAWKVNHQWKKLYSEALDEKVGLNVTAHTLRCIDKKGGLDNYLLSITSERELGVKGLAARTRIVEALENATA
jgi:large subunit ribosomal protein L28